MKVNPGWIVPITVFYSLICLTMLVLFVRSIDKKMPVEHNCAYYVDTAEYRGQSISHYGGFTSENELVVRAEFHSEVMRIEETYGATGCTEISCPDSVEVRLFRLCDTSSYYEPAIIDVVTFR